MADDEYHKKINISHPAPGIDVPEEERRAHILQHTILAREESVGKECQEEREILRQAMLDGRLQKEPQTYADMLTNQYGAEFTRRFYEFSTLPKDALKKIPQQPVSQMETNKQQNVLVNAMSAFTNMHIAHEICINTEYRLKPQEKKDTMENRVAAMMRKAFWDLVDEDLGHDPPVYDHALAVFEEIKEKLLGLLLPHNGAIRLRIEDTLDMVEIKKELEHDALDFQKYITFTIDCLAKLCSPSRDEQIDGIRKLEKPSEIFSHLFDAMDAMQLDMANYMISVYRPKIMEHCITYERGKFLEFLQLEHDIGQYGLRSTREWLLRHKLEGRDTPSTIAKAFGEIITWDYKNAWPETLALDAVRLADIARSIKRGAIFGAMVLSVIEFCKPLFAQNYFVINTTVRNDLDKQFKILLPLQDMNDEEKIAYDIEACADEAVRVVAKHLEAIESRTLTDLDGQLMRQAVKDVSRPDNKVRSVLMLRIVQYMEETIFSESKYKVTLTPGLALIKTEVELCTSELSRIVLHNRNAYNDVYCDIIEGRCVVPNVESKDTKNPEYEQYLKKLKETHRSSQSMAKEPLPVPPSKTLSESSTVVKDSSEKVKIPFAPFNSAESNANKSQTSEVAAGLGNAKVLNGRPTIVHPSSDGTQTKASKDTDMSTANDDSPAKRTKQAATTSPDATDSSTKRNVPDRL